jgi:hypothetical protein
MTIGSFDVATADFHEAVSRASRSKSLTKTQSQKTVSRIIFRRRAVALTVGRLPSARFDMLL